MNCPVCGCPDPSSAADTVCARCSLLQAMAIDATPPVAGDEPLLSVPGYELIHPLGRGAMGTVWLAREEILDRLVALKLIPHGGDPVLADRLLREGRAAAQLSHPHIVAVFALGGAGAATFLAMEFHEGGNLADRLQGKALPPRSAAALAASLAAALAHAHAAGILHRDIKPSNVLLNAGGAPLLADFGLASPLDGRGDLTRVGEIGGTPTYLAPELLQTADAASPQSDLYSLGVLLYVVATGRPPFAGASSAALLREIVERDPPPPRLVQPAIPRDLETIILHCLEKVPARRYPSAAALEADLRRFLDGQPILARPASRAEKTLRWCRRRPAAATALVLSGVLLLLLAVGGPLVAWKLERSRRAAAEAAATATAIADFLRTDLLAQASPDNQPNREIKLRTVVDQASAKVGQRFADRPAIEAAIRQTLGETYLALGDSAAAQAHFERALQLRLPAGGLPTTKDARVSLNALASALYFQGKVEAAAAIFQRVAESGAVPTPDDTTVSEALGNWGMMLQKEGHFAEGGEHIRQALTLTERLEGAEAPLTLVLMNNFIGGAMFEGNYDAAADMLRKLWSIRLRVSGPDHPDTVTVLANLGFVERLQHHYQEAEDAGRKVLAVRRRVSGPDHIYTLIAMGDLAQTLKEEGRLPEAETLDHQAMDASLRTLGASHPQTLSLAGAEGDLLLLLHRPAEAERVLRTVLEAQPKGAPADWRVAVAQSRWGQALAELGRPAEGRPALSASYAALQQQGAKIPRWNKSEIALAKARLDRLTLEAR